MCIENCPHAHAIVKNGRALWAQKERKPSLRLVPMWAPRFTADLPPSLVWHSQQWTALRDAPLASLVPTPVDHA